LKTVAPSRRGYGTWVGLGVSLAVTFTAAGAGGLATSRAPEFYAALSRPGWAPPAWLFGPVWTLLYVLMAVAAWLVWRERGVSGARIALALFGAQLVLNAAWSWLFFAWRLGTIAAVEIVVLLALIALTVMAFWRVRAVAGALLLPYLAWVGYATAFALALVRRNPALLG
jgi:translocator protein